MTDVTRILEDPTEFTIVQNVVFLFVENVVWRKKDIRINKTDIKKKMK